jgi:hypothetical protein
MIVTISILIKFRQPWLFFPNNGIILCKIEVLLSASLIIHYKHDPSYT